MNARERSIKALFGDAPIDTTGMDGEDHFYQTSIPTLTRAIQSAIDDERERCAKIVQGEVYKERYRKWPQISEEGNLSNDSYTVKHCNELAAVIRTEPTKGVGQ